MKSGRVFFVMSGVLLLTGCDFFSDRYARTTDGHLVPLPRCKAAVDYQGVKWSVRGAKSRSAEVGSIEWEKTFRDVSPLIEVLDKQEVNNCRMLKTQVSVSSLEEVRKILAARSDANAKLDQLSVIVASKDSEALKRFIDVYFRLVDPSFYEEYKDRGNDSIIMAKTSNTEVPYKLRNIDARPASAVLTTKSPAP